LFTGSMEVARLIQKQLASRLTPDGKPIPFIAETGGLNAMMVDSSALPEQVVTDVLASAFDSAGQRCSALRILCLQEDVADHMLAMLKGAMAELSIGSPDRLSVDVGPVITPAAAQSILSHIEAMRARKFPVHQLPLPPQARLGNFVPPTIIELAKVSDLEKEVFGPVLHVVRYKREDLDDLIAEINASGYGLTFGLHSRIDETIAHVSQRVNAGNIYVNRNVIGAVVGVQPFGGHGLSGTGPKAGGPLYLRRLLSAAPPLREFAARGKAEAGNPFAAGYLAWLAKEGHATEARHCQDYMAQSPLGFVSEMPGPVGERNIYALVPRGRLRAVPRSRSGLLLQIGAALATGNGVVVADSGDVRDVLDKLPPDLLNMIHIETASEPLSYVSAVLFEGDGDALIRQVQAAAEATGGVVPVFAMQNGGAVASSEQDYPLEWLVSERTISTNTTAAGGNASLMSVG